MATVMTAREADRAPATAPPVAITVEGVSKAFGPLQALVDIDVRVGAGEFVSVIGPSGCGKTTLLKIIAGLVPADRGRVRVGEREVTGPGRECSVVFQDFALLPWATVQRNVEFGLLLRHDRHCPAGACRDG